MSVADELGHRAKAPALAVRQRSISHGKQHLAAIPRKAASGGLWWHLAAWPADGSGTP